jgi:hypothetical protein
LGSWGQVLLFAFYSWGQVLLFAFTHTNAILLMCYIGGDHAFFYKWAGERGNLAILMRLYEILDFYETGKKQDLTPFF